jgi:nitrate reductase gamma subunit
MGTMCLAGLLILLHRRLTNARVSAVTRFGDKVLLLWLLVTLLLGLSTIFESASHMDGHMMVLLMTWAQHIVTCARMRPAMWPRPRCSSRRTCSWASRCSRSSRSRDWCTSGAALPR